MPFEDTQKEKGLSELEIVHCLKNFNFITTVENIRKPTPQLMQQILEALMKDLQLSPDAVKQEPFKVTVMLENRESFEDVIPFASFFSISQQIMDIAGIKDFGVKDIMEPKPKRTKKILNYLIIFWKHVITKINQYVEMETKCQSEIEAQEKLVENYNLLKDRYDEAVASRIDPAEVQAALKKKEVVEQRLKDFVAAKDAANKANQDMKVKLAFEQKNINDLDVKVVSAKERLQELSNQILNSPARLESELKDIKDEIAEDDEKILDMKRKTKERKQGVEAYQSKINSIEKLLEELKESGEKYQLMRERFTVISQLQQKAEDDSAKCKQLEADVDARQSKIFQCESKMTKFRLQKKSQVENKQKLREMLQESISKEEEISKEVGTEATGLKVTCEKLENKIDALNEKCEAVQEKALAEITPLRREFQEYLDHCSSDVRDAIKEMKLM